MAATDTTVISDYSDFLKEFYTPIIYDTLKRKSVFFDDIVTKHDSENVSGNYALIPVTFDNWSGFGSRSENAALPLPGKGQYDTAKVQMTYNYQVMQVSRQLLKASEGDRGSFAPALTQETEAAMRAWLQNMNRMILGDGTGKLFQLDGSFSTRTASIDNAWGIADDLNGDLFVSENVRVNFFTGTTLRSSAGDGTGICTIKTYTRGSGSETSATITLVDTDVTTGLTDGDYAYVAGNKADGVSTCKESAGLMALIDDGTLNGTFQNISTTTRPDWKAWVRYGSTAGTAEPLTRARMSQVYKDITAKGGGMIDYLFCGPDTEETYLELADANNFTVNQTKLDVASNWEGPAYKGKPILTDPLYPEGRIEFIDRRALAIYQEGSPEWIPGDVGVLQKVAGYDNYIAEYAWFMQFGIRNRHWVGSLRDISTVI